MTCGIDADIRANEAIVPNGDRSFVQNGKVEIGEELPPDPDVAAVVAIEGLVNEGVFITISKKTPEQIVPFLKHRRTQLVVLPDPVLGCIEFFQKKRMGGIIDLAGDHIVPNLGTRSIPCI